MSPVGCWTVSRPVIWFMRTRVSAIVFLSRMYRYSRGHAREPGAGDRISSVLPGRIPAYTAAPLFCEALRTTVVCIWPDPREPANKGLCSGQGSATLDLRTDVPHAQRFLGRGASGDFYRHHAYPDIPPRRIVIKCTGEQPQYLRALPLHYSQEETEQHDGWSLFGYYLAPTNEFYRKILAPREFMEIVSPEEVRQEYAAILEKMLGQHR